MHKEHNIVELIEMQHNDVPDKAIKEIEAIIRAYAPNSGRSRMILVSWDVFLLGYIYGKRAERARRAKKTTQTA